MSWWGMLLGGTFGFLIGGPIGAVLGAALGRHFGRAVGSIEAGPGVGASGQERAQLAFFTATFGVMGQVAKADGHVSPDEIRLANRVMDELGLDAEQRRAARAIFNEGKSLDFPSTTCSTSSGRSADARPISFACSSRSRFRRPGRTAGCTPRSGGSSPTSRPGSGSPRRSTSRSSGWWARAPMPRGPPPGRPWRTPTRPSASLRIRPDAEVKRAYRRLMSRHHPDKLASKGLPEEMMRAATERTQQIKAAWDRVQSARASGSGSGPRAA